MAKGSTQKEGIDYEETFFLVAMKEWFDMKDLDEANYILEIKIL